MEMEETDIMMEDKQNQKQNETLEVMPENHEVVLLETTKENIEEWKGKLSKNNILRQSHLRITLSFGLCARQYPWDKLHQQKAKDSRLPDHNDNLSPWNPVVRSIENQLQARSILV